MIFFKNKNLKFLLLGLFLAFSVMSVITLPVFAQTATDTLGVSEVNQNIALGGSDLRVTVVKIINTVLGLLGIIALGIVLYGGFTYMTAGGDEAKVSTAKKILTNGIIGLVIILSAFAITKFVLNKLAAATGLRDVTNIDTTLIGDCDSPGTAYYEAYADTVVCDPADICRTRHFFVQSITPSTKDNDVVGMNNVVIRAVFSRGVGSQLAQALKIDKDGTDVTGKFTLSFSENNHVIQAVPTTQDGCNDTVGGHCLAKGTYNINVLDVKDLNGNNLEVNTDCGTFPKNATFKVGDENNILDNNSPSLSATLDNMSGDNIHLVAGRTYAVKVSANDRNVVTYGGNSYVALNIYKLGAEANILKSYLEAPIISFGSSNQFDFTYNYRVPVDLLQNVDYVLDIIGHDIDNNVTHQILKFRVVPAICDNGVQDPGEDGVDTGGVCPGGLGTSCKVQADCSTSFKCLDTQNNICAGTSDCVCKKWTYIENIEKNNGAPGNWITITGRNFGNSEGQIYFNYDTNGDNVFDFANIVSLAQCRGDDVWNDNWIIAEVPNKPAGVTVNPVISVKNLELAGPNSASTSTPKYPSPLNPGHVLNLHLDEISGTTITDSSNAHNNLQVIGNVAFGNDGKFGKAVSFDKDLDNPSLSIDDKEILKLRVNAGDSLDLVKGSIFAWIKKTDNTIGYDTIVSKDSSYGLFLANNKLAVGEWYPSGGGRVIPSNTNVVDGKWHQVGLVFDKGVTNGTKLYVDGNLVLTTTTQFFSGYAGDFVVGATNGGTAYFYTGFIDEVNVWNRVLSQDEITSLYNTVVPSYKFTDFANDNFGPNLGVFTYNNIKRPGLCSVKTADGLISAEAKTAVTAKGKSFGSVTGNLVFGDISAGVASWADETIGATVPFAGEGKNAVYVQLPNNGEKSNPVWFTVSAVGADTNPIITHISPVTTTPGSYITITGRNFGSSQGSGNVTIGGVNFASLPDYCGTGWSDTQIVAKVASTTPFGLDNVYIINDSGKTTSSTKTFVNIVSGQPQPSICKISPEQGSAPLANNQYLTLRGENFTLTPQDAAYFWKDNANPQDPTTWLTNDQFHSNTITSIEVAIPYDIVSGLSMSSGPIVVKASNKFSNDINYEVVDCRLPGQQSLNNFQCCQIGPEEGAWKIGRLACKDTTRDGGYVWRFTTGKIAEKFLVLEQCDSEHPGNVVPSPTPWSVRKEGKITCVNAQIEASFTLPVDDADSNIQNFHIFTCGGNENNIDCTTEDTSEVTSDFTANVSNSQNVVFEKNDEGNLAANKWYTVAMGAGLQSLKDVTEAGHNVTKNEKIQPTRPCTIKNIDYAYCFDFRTGNENDVCTLVDAGIKPSDYHTSLLGVIQDIRWPLSYDLKNIFNVSKVRPQYFDVYGIGNQQCIVLNVDDKPWEWGPEDNTTQSATAEKKNTDARHENSRGIASAWSNNPGGSDIFARLDIVETFSEHNVLTSLGATQNYQVTSSTDVLTATDSNSDYSLYGNFVFSAQVHLDDVADSDYEISPSSFPGYVGDSGVLRRYIINKVGEYSVYFFQNYSKSANNLTVENRNFELSFSYGDDFKQNVVLVADQKDFKIEISKLNNSLVIKINDEVKGTFNNTNNIKGGGNVFVGNVDTLFANNFNLLKGKISYLNVRSTEDSSEDIVATSTIYIDLGDPEVVDRWPSCTEACINAEMGAQFNQIMIPTTYSSGLHLSKCANESCVNGLIPVDFDISEANTNASTLRFYSKDYLVTSTWYLVELDNNIKASGGIDTEGNHKEGNPLQITKWKFRTKSSSEPCVVDNVDIVPDPFSAYYIGQQQIYRAVPRGAIDSCSPYGQALDPRDYGWDWGVANDNNAEVAEITDFSISGKYNNFCTQNCLPKGSDIAYATNNNNYPICGNGIVDLGEDCDIAGTTTKADGSIVNEEAGVSCSYNCLRPAANSINVGGTCGNEVVDRDKGEECDSSSSDPTQNSYCSPRCLWIGSSNQVTGNVGAPICGSGAVTIGEDCDGGSGCSNNCLHLGTSLSQHWCDNQTSSVAACKNASSICGDGFIEAGEECEVGKNGATSSNCDNKCLLKNVCKTALAQCYEGSMGCNSDCTLAGSSLSYRSPSVCGDGVNGAGEGSGTSGEVASINFEGLAGNYSCELDDGGQNELGGNFAQIVTAVGNPSPDSDPREIIDAMTAKIFAIPVKYYDDKGNVTSTKSNTVRGEGDYSLMCGYNEYSQLQDDAYNDCPNNTINNFGVGTNSCCYYRPVRSGQYPAVNAGVSGDEPVCRNTYLEVDFATEMKKISFNNNVSIIEGYDKASSYRNYSCAEHGQTDVTVQINRYLNRTNFETAQVGFWKNIWLNIKAFFANLFGGKVFAFEQNSNLDGKNIIWCATRIAVTPEVKYNYNGQVVSSTAASLLLSEALDPNVYVLVILNGGKDGVKDKYGVGIKNANPNSTIIDDYWLFKTGSEICKIQNISVDPAQKVFSTPNSSFDFSVKIASNTGGQLISPIPNIYDWKYSWSPSNNAIFTIPNNNSSTISIASKGVEGQIDALASVEVISDVDTENSQLGDVFSKNFKLTAFFCTNPWPTTNTRILGTGNDSVSVEGGLFEDQKYNFSFIYCADNNDPLTINDDLPLFDNVQLVGNNLDNIDDATGDVALRRYLLFASSTNDALGIQVFENTPKFDGSPRSLQDWYNTKFGSIGEMKLTSIDNYEALTDGTSYYVNVFDVDKTINPLGDVYNYVVLFSLTNNSSQDTTQVFEQIINNLKFNIKMTDYNKCLGSNQQDVYETRQSICTPPDKESGKGYCTGNFTEPIPCTGPEDDSCERINEQSGCISGDNEQKVCSLVSQPISCTTNNDCRLLESGAKRLYQVKIDSGVILANPSVIRSGTAESNITDIDCNTDFDCRDNSGQPLLDTSGYCNNEKTKFFRDLNRLFSLRVSQNNLSKYFTSDYGRDDFVGNLKSGSFIPGYTTSKWQNSWGLLNSYAGTVSVDPVNQWVGCSDHDPLTCWNASSSTYKCPTFAEVYEYKFVSSTQSYNIYAPFEYLQSINDSDFVSRYIDQNKIIFGRYCTPDDVISYSTSNFTCGDGIVNYAVGEECEPPNSTKFVDRSATGGLCSPGTKALATCSPNNCKWSVSSSCNTYGAKACGDGILDSTYIVTTTERSGDLIEQCDDGELNGRYSHCDINCQKPGESSYSGPGFCGDSIPQPQYEYCEKSESKYVPGFCEFDKKRETITNGCSTIANCQLNRRIVEGQSVECTSDNAYCTRSEVVTKVSKCGDDNFCIGGVTQRAYCLDDGTTPEGSIPNGCAFAVAHADICDGPYGDDAYECLISCEDDSLCSNYTYVQTEYFEDYGRCLSAAVPSYDFNKANSCSYDCSVAGGYCGDGITQWDYEDCDDGNLNDNDACKIDCTLPGVAGGQAVCGNSFVEEGEDCDHGSNNGGVDDSCSTSCKNVVETPVCGNNQVDIGEQCDLGTQNGVNCTPEYGRSCTYCSNTCLVQTLEASQRCGNGIVDKDTNNNWLEQCDYTLDNEGKQQFVFDRNSATQAPLSCNATQRGVYQCTNNCQLVQNSCVTCGSGTNLPVPKLAVLNTLTNDLSGEYAQNKWDGNTQFLTAYVKNLQDGKYNALDLYMGGANSISLSAFKNQETTKIADSINTNQLCIADYKIFVNKGLSDGVPNQITGNDLDLAEQSGYGSVFDYPYMPSDANELENEIILNPKVLSGKMRVVIRWQQKNGIHFVGNVYSDTNIEGDPYSVRYSEVAAADELCSVMNVWDILTCKSYQGVGIRSVFSEYVTGLFSSVQSVSFDSLGTVSTPVDDMDIFAFYVSALEAPINQLKDYAVWVDVYVGRSGSPYAYVKPDYSFSLNNAKPSNNATANYWHVFNIGRFSNQAIIIPISATEPISVPVSTFYGFYADISSGYNGAIATSLCQVKENMPNTTKCQL
ncbi:MAG: hypothetical protein ACD_18C00141G0007 [uncultured bacterium]|nr:MAG: hypothetical protein ACD_18C00141G0007 [uncultured bacterium]OGH88876.1 MAG: hypothetical protein A2507_03225 [Candidatus Magasanikbacteria bacterium RIFOXYD12_FULL_33_17]HAO52540.1 hypothetical protein [Candidatus Magasanikbacteria bacterium]